MVFGHQFSVARMLGRPLLRAAASELCGIKPQAVPQMCRRSLSSIWMPGDDKAPRDGENRQLSGRIHVLGLGKVGTFVAHSLAGRLHPPPITLLMHNPLLYRDFLQWKRCLSVNNLGMNDDKTGFDIDVLIEGNWRSAPREDADFKDEEHTGLTDEQAISHKWEDELVLASDTNEPIECLILSVKAPATIAALQSVRHRLGPNSTILFLQNGMGVIDKVNSQIFPDPNQRPHYMLGIISHGLGMLSNRFHVAHNGVGTTVIGPAPSKVSRNQASNGEEPDWAPTTKYLMRTLTLTPPLVAVAEPPTSIMLYQLEKLAMNSVINPLTALMECKNGELLYNYSFTRLMRLLLMEISRVICNLPELQGIPGIENRFSPERLRWMVTQLAQKTAANRSSMLQDVWGRKTTEIDYLNGYIIRRGEELGIRCVSNYMIKHMVLAKLLGRRVKESSEIPFDLGEESRKGGPEDDVEDDDLVNDLEVGYERDPMRSPKDHLEGNDSRKS